MQTIQFKTDTYGIIFFKTLLENLKFKIQGLSITNSENTLVKENEKQIETDSYFKSQEDKYIYYLVELDGEIRQEKLNIKPIFYKDKIKAKKWRNNITKIINPDISNHLKAEEASKNLNNIYANMIKNAK